MKTDILKLTSPMMHGPAVKRLQEQLDTIGIDTGENDGIFGSDTAEAVKRFQRRYSISVDGVMGRRSKSTLMQAITNAYMPNSEGTLSSHGLVDISGSHPKPKLYKCKRPWSRITGVTLHQTGCEMPRSAMGWQRVNAHIGVTQEGVAILLNPLTDWIWHAQGLSKTTIGIEIEGNYYGINGDKRTLWKGGGGPHHLNAGMLSALDLVRVMLEEEFNVSHGDDFEGIKIFGHRQSKDTRRGDPGEEIWREVSLKWNPNTINYDLVHGSGRPIPKEWDSRSDGRY